MDGQRSLPALLATLDPALVDGVWVFARAPVAGDAGTLASFVAASFATVHEAEGLTLVMPEALARDHSLEAAFRCRIITLTVHSSLDAVGLLATVTRPLADAGISVNPLAGFFHDHLCVPPERADEAITRLRELQRSVGA